jgi:putative addiction module killer protein
MIDIRFTDAFRDWRDGPRDQRAKAAIARRIDRLASGNPGDVKPVGEGVSEMRIDYGPGYRVYFVRRGALLILLLCGGDKSSQPKDIAKAVQLAKSWTGNKDDQT